MDLEIILLSEVSQKEKDENHMLSLICEILQNDTNVDFYLHMYIYIFDQTND